MMEKVKSRNLSVAEYFDVIQKEYYIAVYKKNDDGEAMKDVTFDVKVNGTETKKALKTGASS